MHIARAQIKKEAKEKLRGHWGEAILVGLLPFLVLFFTEAAAINQAMATMKANPNAASAASDSTNLLARSLLLNASAGTSSIQNILLDLLATLLMASTALGFLSLWRREPDQMNPFVRSLIGFRPEYIGGLIVNYIVLSLIGYIPSLIGAIGDKLWIDVLMSIAFICVVIIQIGFSQTYYIYHDAVDAGHGNIFQALKLSWQLMSGFKWQYFVLQLSFIGWSLLTLFLGMLPYLWIYPYMSMTFAGFYTQLKEYKPDLLNLAVSKK